MITSQLNNIKKLLYEHEYKINHAHYKSFLYLQIKLSLKPETE